MEDRYLCKAKRTDNGKWIIGGLVRYGFAGRENTISFLITHQIYMLWKLIHPQFVGTPDSRTRTEG